MGRKNTEDDVRKKFSAFGVRLTCYVSGTRKTKFQNDQLKRGIGEGEVLKGIMDIHYSIIEEIPEMRDKEFTELKKYIIDKIKFKP